MHSLLEDLNAQFPAHDESIIEDFCRLMFGDVLPQNKSKEPNSTSELRADNLRALGSLGPVGVTTDHNLVGAFYPVNNYSPTRSIETQKQLSAGGSALEMTKKPVCSSGDKLSTLVSIPEDGEIIHHVTAPDGGGQVVENDKNSVAGEEEDEPNVILEHLMYASMDAVKKSAKLVRQRSLSYYGPSDVDLFRRPG